MEEVLYKLFLHLRKSYDALDRERHMDILVRYGVVQRMEKIIRYSWYHLSMVARSGCYYVTPFKVHRWVTQGYPLSPTIMNMVVGILIHH